MKLQEICDKIREQYTNLIIGNDFIIKHIVDLVPELILKDNYLIKEQTIDLIDNSPILSNPFIGNIEVMPEKFYISFKPIDIISVK